MADAKTSGFLKTALKVFLAVDVVFALLLATMQSLVLNQVGVAFGANGTATTVATGLTWIESFVIGLIVCGMFLLFSTLILALWLFAWTKLTQNGEAKTKRAINTIFALIALAVFAWAAVQATLHALVLNQVGALAHANHTAVAVVTILSWLFTFAIGLFQGEVFFTIIAGGTFVVLVAATAIFGNGRQGAKGVPPGPIPPAPPRLGGLPVPQPPASPTPPPAVSGQPLVPFVLRDPAGEPPLPIPPGFVRNTDAGEPPLSIPLAPIR